MAWVTDAVDAQYTIDTVTKQRSLLPSTGAFSRFPTDHVLRVFQLDGVSLQQELVEILHAALFQVFDIPPLQHLRFAYQEELLLVMDAVLYRCSVWRSAQTVGDRVQNLVMRDEERARQLGLHTTKTFIPSLAPSRRLLFVHAIMTILMPYLVRKAQRKMLEENWESDSMDVWHQRAAKAFRYAIISWSVLSLLNTFHFLATGQYRSLVERLLSLRLVYGSQNMHRFTNLFYLNQHIWWSTWISLLTALGVGKYLRRLIASARSFAASPSSLPMSESACCACHELPTVPQRTNCGHLYCYYCVKSRLLDAASTGSFPCFKCSQPVRSCAPA